MLGPWRRATWGGVQGLPKGALPRASEAEGWYVPAQIFPRVLHSAPSFIHIYFTLKIKL